jgi:hypothetical protein
MSFLHYQGELCGTAQLRFRSAPAQPASGARSAGAKGKGGAAGPEKSRSRGGFDTGTPRGGSIGLIAGKRTAAAPVSNPPLRGAKGAGCPWKRRSETGASFYCQG